jgi:hypothetical protein
MVMLGNIVVGLTATTGRFQRDMNRAAGTVKSFTAGAAAGIGKVAAFGSAIMGIAGVGSLGMLMKSSMKNIDATAKLADRIGETTERLQGLRYAADITGAGSENLDKSLQKMQKTVGEASQGIGQGRLALNALGLSVDDLAGKSPAEQFSLIAENVNKLKTAEDRAFVATNLFGRSGQSLINTLALGKDGLAAMQAEAEKLGIAFSRVDAAKVEAANDALTRVGRVFQGIGNALAIELSPYIESAAMKFVELAGSGEGMGNRVANGIRWVAESIAKAADMLNLFSAGFYTVKSGVETLVAGALNGFAMLSSPILHIGGIFNTIVAGVLNGAELIKAAGYGMAAVFGEAFGTMLRHVAKGIANLEFEAKKVWNYWKRVTLQISDVDEIKANMAARYVRDDRVTQITSAGDEFSKKASENLDLAGKAYESGSTGKAGAAFDRRAEIMRGAASAALESGLSGAAGAAWDAAAKESADNAVSAYDKFVNGSAQKQVAGFFDSIQQGAQVAAEKVAANAAAYNAPKSGIGEAIGESSVRGSFSAAALIATPEKKIAQDQLAEQKKMNRSLERIVDATEDDEGATAA